MSGIRTAERLALAIVAIAMPMAGCAGPSSMPETSSASAMAWLSDDYDVWLTEARTPVLVSGSPDINCVGVQAQANSTLLTMQIVADWNATSPLTESLYLDALGSDDEGRTASLGNVRGHSPLEVNINESSVPVPGLLTMSEGESITIYLGSSREAYGGAVHQAVHLVVNASYEGDLRTYDLTCTLAN